MSIMLSKHIDALILVGSTYAGTGATKEETDYIRKAASKDYQAAYDVTMRLIVNGRRRILFLTDSHSYSANQKRMGYETALTYSNIPVDERLQLFVKNDIYQARDLLLSRQENSFDSVFATDDGLAVGIVKYAMGKGLRIPDDIEIVGYNNSFLCICSNPELTSVDNCIFKVCDDTVERLLKVLDGKESVSAHNIVDCSIVHRNTTSF